MRSTSLRQANTSPTIQIDRDWFWSASLSSRVRSLRILTRTLNYGRDNTPQRWSPGRRPRSDRDLRSVRRSSQRPPDHTPQNHRGPSLNSADTRHRSRRTMRRASHTSHRRHRGTKNRAAYQSAETYTVPVLSHIPSFSFSCCCCS